MKAGFLLAMLLAAAVATPVQGRGSFGPSVGGAGHSGMNGGPGQASHGGPGQGGVPRGGFHGQSHDHGFGRHHRFHDRRWARGGWGYPYGGDGDWSDCGDETDGCDSGGYQRPSDDYGYADPPAPCDGGAPHPGEYEWATSPCGPGLGEASPARRGRASAGDCSDWVWRADLRHPVCRRRASG